MLANLVLILITLLVLYFVGMLWLRQNLLSDLRSLGHRQDLLMKDHEKLRDQVPLLLESIREMEEPSDLWRKIVADRAVLQVRGSLQGEEQFLTELQQLVTQTKLNSLNYLEAKAGMEEMLGILAKTKEERQKAIESYNQRRAQFPYSLASAIFGFKEA